MVNPCDSLNASKAHAIDLQAQALLLDGVTVSLRRSIVINELTPTTDTDVILLTSSLAVLTGVSRLTLWTLH
jgi:hypothetical protein